MDSNSARFVKFNNEHPDHRGNVVYINPNHVASVVEIGNTTLTTQISLTNGIIYSVDDSPEQVIKKLSVNLLVE